MGDTGFDLSLELLEASKDIGLVKHEARSKSYILVSPEEREFPRADWPAVLQDFGGPQKFYDYFLEWSAEMGIISPWD